MSIQHTHMSESFWTCKVLEATYSQIVLGAPRHTGNCRFFAADHCSLQQIRWTSTSGVVWAAGKTPDGAVECAGGKLRILVLQEASDPAKVAVMRMQLGHVTCCFACIVSDFASTGRSQVSSQADECCLWRGWFQPTSTGAPHNSQHISWWDCFASMNVL